MTNTADKQSTEVKTSIFFWSVFSIPVTILLIGFIVSHFWDWFIVTQFGAKPLGVLASIGTLLTFRAIAGAGGGTCKSDKEKGLGEVIQDTFLAWAKWGLIFLIGFIVWKLA